MVSTHDDFMSQALELAKHAASLGEVPVGAVVVLHGQIVGRGFNKRELKACAVEHAEISAIKEACQTLGRWRLTGAIVYATLEPCIMCTGAMLHARIDCLVYGAADTKFGAIKSLYQLACDPRLNHRFSAQGGVQEQKSAQLLKDFFKHLRA